MLQKNASVNIFNSYVAAQEAVKGWKELSPQAKPTFIYTGNCANTTPLVSLVDLSIGKSGAAAFIAVAAEAYQDRNFK